MNKFKPGDNIRHMETGNRYVIKEVYNDYYVNSFRKRMDMAYTDANFELVEDPKPVKEPQGLNEAAEEQWAAMEYVSNTAREASSARGWQTDDVVNAFKAGAAWRDAQIPKLPDNLGEAAEEYLTDKNVGELYQDFTKDTFKAGAKWAMEQGLTCGGRIMKSSIGETYVESDYIPIDGKCGDRVLIKILKDPGEEKKPNVDEVIEELVPRSLLTEDQIKEMNGFEYKSEAIRYINSISNIGLKVAATYYELYNDKNLKEDDDNRRES